MRYLLFPCFIGCAAAQIPAFPGAEGYGAYANGGRGGDVYHVTNLGNIGTGSLRYGIETAPVAGRTIVFAVSGYIPIPSSGLRMTKPNVTIAGQTAPGDGIGLRNGTFRISASDAVIRHLRFRHGKNGSGGDCMNLDSACTDAVLDHISMQFSTDENFSSFSTPPENLTMQWSLNGWGLESHSCGGLWDQNHATAHHTLWSHNHTRNPKARPAGLLEWVNNVTFDWDIGFIMGDSETPASWKANVIGNYFICPASNLRSRALEKANLDRNGNPNFTIHVADNRIDKNGNAILDGTDEGYGIASGSYTTSANPIANTGSRPVSTDGPLLAYKKIVSSAGALRLEASPASLRDEVDTILVNNLVTRTANHITRESDLAASASGFGTLNSAPAPIDSDKDGMPDVYETALGWNAAVQDHNTALGSSGGFVVGPTYFPANTAAGFTRLEEYLHFLATPHASMAKNTAAQPSSIAINLARYTSGFSNSPVFTSSNVSGGSVVIAGSTATFTPTQNAAGRARFDFTVADGDGSQWTQTFNLLVSSTGVPRDLVWQGDGTANPWNTSSPVWSRNGSATVFGAGDHAILDDRGSATPMVNVTEAITAGSMTVDATKNYSISGSGPINSTGPLVKRGSGKLTLSTPTSFAAAGSIEEGTLEFAEGAFHSGGSLSLLDGTALTNAFPAGNTFSIGSPLSVPVGQAAQVNTGNRFNWSGALSGEGDLTFNIQTTVSRVDIKGSTSVFSGNLKFINSGNVRLFINGGAFDGLANARVSLEGAVGLQPQTNSGGNTIPLGSLSGNSAAASIGPASAGAPTWQIGGLNLDSSYAGSIQGSSIVTKLGTGTLTLSGTLSHSGATMVSAGTLTVNGSIATSPVVVESGATLTGTGSFGGLVTVNSGGKINPGNAATLYRSLPANGGLTVAGGTLIYDLSSNPAGPNDKITVPTGKATNLSGTVNFQLNFAEGSLGAGTYPLIDGNATQSVSGLTMVPLVPAPAGTTRQTFTLNRPASGTTPGYVNLLVTGTAGNLTWTGANGGIWDLATTAGNWSGASPDTFSNLDLVNFTDGPTTGNVSLSGPVQPARITVNNSATTFTISGSGLIGGAPRLIKNGNGTLNIGNSATNTFSGGTVINSGTIALTTTTGLLGSGPISMNGGTLQLPNAATFLSNPMVLTGTSSIVSPYSGNSTIINSTASALTSTGDATLNLSGLNGILSINGSMSGFSGTVAFGNSSGMLRLNSNSSAANDVNFGSAATHFDLGSGNATLTNRNGDIAIHLGALSGGANTHLNGRQSGSGATSTTYIVGELNSSTTFAGNIATAGDLGGLNLIKAGTGTWTVGGSSNFTGTVTVDGGTLAVSGSLLSTGSSTVATGATLSLAGGTFGPESTSVAGSLGGHGTLDSDLNCTGTLTGRGFSSGTPGTLSIGGSASFGSDAVLRLRAGSSSDIIAVAGDLGLGGTLQVGLAPGTGFGRYTLFTYTGTRTGHLILTGTSGHLSTSTAGQVALVIDDSDEDGLPDTWEQASFGNLAQTPAGDADQDGTPNLAELRLGLNPSSGSSAFRATLTGHTLAWPSAAGIVFTVKRSLSLENGPWQSVGTVTGAGQGTASFTDPSGFTRAFYRVEFTP
ncbi:autotransporter-associated beta strand repeat-containing protein [Luteolibacter sp. Populi]|uniref:autotransporter-associated beta strand repeat-containing protein n=1 Tax=Luteolibacter sp. Populi TaxID=3230487 RepID=UPI003467E15E